MPRHCLPADVIHSIEQFGCAWLKRLFDPTELKRFDAVIATNIDGIEKVYRDLGLGDAFNIGFPLYFASEANRDWAQQLFRNSYPGVFDSAKMTGAESTKLAAFVFAALRRCGLRAWSDAKPGISPGQGQRSSSDRHQVRD
jgi:hypothetical protein